MNVLVVGGASSLLNQLIRKIKKEGHRVYLLSGKRYGVAGYEKVFERYDLPYDSANLSDVFESVNPDVTLFMGAFDSNFRWNEEEREMVQMVSGLTNLLISHSMVCKGRFIFLSSSDVYSDSFDADIPEDTPTSPSGIKAMALSQCEEMCTSFRRTRETDVVVLRVDNYYLIPKEPDDVNDICSRMCLEALRTGGITVDKGHRFSLLYESDAVEFIFRLIRCGEHQYPVYNLSSSEELTELEIARYIQQAMTQGTGVYIDEKEKQTRRCVLANGRFDSEFNGRIFADTRQTVEKVALYMAEHKELFLTNEQEKKGLFRRLADGIKGFIKALIPYLENLICFVAVFLLNSGILGSQYLERLDLYLLYVLLFAVVYGQYQATFSALLAIIGTFFAQIRDNTVLDVVLDYGTYLWIAQLFVVGLVVGYIKDQINKLMIEREEEEQFLDRQLTDIKDINGSNVRVKDALETEVVNQRDSIGKVYHVTSKLDQYIPEEVLFYAAETMSELLRSKDIAIYTVSNDTYARLFAFTSEQARTLGKSIRYRELDEVYETVAERKVYVNKTLDPRYPMMANAIFDNDQVKTIIMIWGIPWDRMTLGQADLLMVVSYLIQNAVVRATRQIELLENQRYQAGGYVMEQEAFSALVHAFQSARNKGLTECTLLRITTSNVKQGVQPYAPDMPVEPETHGETGKALISRLRQTVLQIAAPKKKQDKQAYAAVGKALISKIRQEDYIGVLEDGNLYLLLSNSNLTDAEFVIKRIESVGYHCILSEDLMP